VPDQHFVPARQKGPVGPRTEVWTCSPDSKKKAGLARVIVRAHGAAVLRILFCRQQAADPVACVGGAFQTTEVKE
jgi:hypothetical protein